MGYLKKIFPYDVKHETLKKKVRIGNLKGEEKIRASSCGGQLDQRTTIACQTQQTGDEIKCFQLTLWNSLTAVTFHTFVPSSNTVRLVLIVD